MELVVVHIRNTVTLLRGFGMMSTLPGNNMAYA